MYMLRETGSKGESSAAEAVITALFGAADDQQDGTLQENELVTFMRMYKYYCYTFTTTKGPVEGEVGRRGLPSALPRRCPRPHHRASRSRTEGARPPGHPPILRRPRWGRTLVELP